MGTLSDSSILSRALFGETRRSALSILFRNPDQLFYVRQMIRLIGSGQGAVQRELATLAEAGILTRSHMGRQVYYQANKSCPIYDELRAIVLKTSGLADVLRAALNPLAGRIRLAFIYGSFASGSDSAASDVDVMVIGDASFEEVVRALQAAQSQLSREVNPTVYPVGEFMERVRSGNHFFTRLSRDKKLFLIGDEHEFTGLASKPVAD